MNIDINYFIQHFMYFDQLAIAPRQDFTIVGLSILEDRGNSLGIRASNRRVK